MWIFIKLVGMIVTYFIRLSSVRWDRLLGGQTETVDGVSIKIVKNRDKHKVLSTSFVYEFPGQTIFKLSPETRIDKFFKSIDFSEEIQTGDNQFDDLIYITCDHIQFRQKITSDLQLRNLLKSFFQSKGRWIKTNGTTLTFNIKGDVSEDIELKQLSVKIQKIFSGLNQNPSSSMMDPFIIKCMVAEACVWSFGIYALLSFLDLVFIHEQDVHFDKWAIIKHGLIWGSILVSFALLIVYLFFRGSSRGHRIFVESFAVLLLTVPMGGIAFLYDLNTGLDRSVSTPIEIQVKNLERKAHRSRKGGTIYSYHLSLQQMNSFDHYSVPTDLRISSNLFYQLQNKHKATMTVRQGWLKYPWIQQIHPN